jgi:ATP-dependent DNA ligase
VIRRNDPPIPTSRRISIPGAKGGNYPGFVERALATLKQNPPDGSNHIHEIKFDGYRVQAHLRGGLRPITVAKMPLAKKPDRKNKMDNWATPKYWAEIGYSDITADGLLRHVTFKGLYETRTAKRPIVAKFR